MIPICIDEFSMLKLEISYFCIIKLVCICIYPCCPVTAAVNLSGVQVVYMPRICIYIMSLDHWSINFIRTLPTTVRKLK